MIIFETWEELKRRLPHAQMVRLCHSYPEVSDYIKSFEGAPWTFGVWKMTPNFYIVAACERGRK